LEKCDWRQWALRVSSDFIKLSFGFTATAFIAGDLMNGGNTHCCGPSSSKRPMAVQAELPLDS